MKTLNIVRQVVHQISWFFFLLLTFLITLPLSWFMLVQLNFGYGFLHDHAGMNANIIRYAPHNIIRPNFHHTAKQERVRLFTAIVKAIHHKGEGLGYLVYYDKNKQPIAPFLTFVEIQHLQDVAHLLRKSGIVILILTIIWLFIVFLSIKFHSTIPSKRQLLLNILFGFIILSGLLFLFKPTQLFYQLHLWVFPANHQWFFYYEESLMSMMMKAPDLFAYIALMLTILSVLFTITLFQLYRYLHFSNGCN